MGLKCHTHNTGDVNGNKIRPIMGLKSSEVSEAFKNMTNKIRPIMGLK